MLLNVIATWSEDYTLYLLHNFWDWANEVNAIGTERLFNIKYYNSL